MASGDSDYGGNLSVQTQLLVKTSERKVSRSSKSHPSDPPLDISGLGNGSMPMSSCAWKSSPRKNREKSRRARLKCPDSFPYGLCGHCVPLRPESYWQENRREWN